MWRMWTHESREASWEESGLWVRLTGGEFQLHPSCVSLDICLLDFGPEFVYLPNVIGNIYLLGGGEDLLDTGWEKHVAERPVNLWRVLEQSHSKRSGAFVPLQGLWGRHVPVGECTVLGVRRSQVCVFSLRASPPTPRVCFLICEVRNAVSVLHSLSMGLSWE